MPGESETRPPLGTRIFLSRHLHPAELHLAIEGLAFRRFMLISRETETRFSIFLLHTTLASLLAGEAGYLAPVLTKKMYSMYQYMVHGRSLN